MKKFILLFSPLVAVIIFLSIVHVVVANMLSTAGVELDRLQTDLTTYQKENFILREKVLADTSLHNIASVAAQMGFIDSKTNVYLPGQVPLAKR